ncbi:MULTISPECIES: GNAT family N-acetyltransferase [Photobacterium]|uniref:GNAT family acetyltransferase n=1 Tax=Photobacterium halotolerans TaxID=265726 RepID=A0A0F5VDZ0_9GAMM|nr:MULTISPECIES: GNAT family N-acetyltransferase [Photobacterium]KKD00386.1 GNAT family acetyltransferase [Photobacterium halotolerans]UIP29663.1 GNAT family N-acetyltransferase [Photobacterium sp. TLY01]
MDVIEIQDVSPMKAALTQLLQNCVDDGASIGFLPPLSNADAEAYWLGVANDLGDGRKLFVACEGDSVIGTVQLALTSKANGCHRAEVEKLMVNTAARGKGVGKALMAKAEASCRQLKRSLIVLDTREGDVASSLYRQLGYIEAGRIPDFALSASGRFDATIFFYKQLTF